MKYSVDKNIDYSIFKLEELNLNSLIAPLLKSEFVFLRNEGVNNLIMDLSDVEYIDSSGLSAILTANRIWKDEGRFILSNINHDPVQRLISISRLETILKITSNLEEAIEFIANEKLESEKVINGPSDN